MPQLSNLVAVTRYIAGSSAGRGVSAYQRLNLGANEKAYGRDAKTSNRTWQIRPAGIIGGPRKTWPWRNCEPTSQPKGREW